MAQGLSALPKGLITAVIVGVAFIILVLLWQKPPPDKGKQNSPVSSVGHKNVSLAPDATVSAPIQSGSGNFQNAPAINQTGGTHPIAQANSGGINLAGDNPVVAGNYYAAPSTPHEKAQQIDRLKSELAEVASFPNRVKYATPSTMLERSSGIPAPLALNEVLSRYYKTTIEAVPVVGDKLYAFKSRYYQFSTNETEFERSAVSKIGASAVSKIREAWEIQFRYYMLRSAGMSVADVKSGGDFLNYGLTWESVEENYNDLSTDALLRPLMKRQLNDFTQLQNLSQHILQEINEQHF